MSVLDLPPMPTTTAPVILPGLLTGLGITPRRTPAWITHPDLIESGLADLPDDLTGDA